MCPSLSLQAGPEQVQVLVITATGRLPSARATQRVDRPLGQGAGQRLVRGFRDFRV